MDGQCKVLSNYITRNLRVSYFCTLHNLRNNLKEIKEEISYKKLSIQIYSQNLENPSKLNKKSALDLLNYATFKIYLCKFFHFPKNLLKHYRTSKLFSTMFMLKLRKCENNKNYCKCKINLF